MTNATANSKPIHSPGVLRYLAGVSCNTTGMSPFGLKANASSPNPSKRCFNNPAKCEVLNVIFSKMVIASGGITAHRNVARRPIPEINNAHP